MMIDEPEWWLEERRVGVGVTDKYTYSGTKSVMLFMLLADPGEAWGCSTNTVNIHSFIYTLIN